LETTQNNLATTQTPTKALRTEFIPGYSEKYNLTHTQTQSGS